MASHSSLRHFTPDWHRNMSDEHVKKVGENGGVVMINFGSSFLSQAARDFGDEIAAARDVHEKEIGRALTPDERWQFGIQYAQTHAYPFATLEDVLNHIDRVVELAGVDHVGIGSDYDGVGPTLPVGLKDVSTFPVLVQGLIDRGYDDTDIEKILGGNALRVWEGVEDARRKRWR